MAELLHQLESTQFGQWVTSDSIFAFPTILLLHTYGIAVVAGLSTGIDLALLGFAPALRLAPMQKVFPIVWVAFWVNAITGTVLFVGDATAMANRVFAVKMLFVLLGVITLRLIQKRVFREPGISQGLVPAGAKTLAVTSLICWLGAITAGRLLAYVSVK